MQGCAEKIRAWGGWKKDKLCYTWEEDRIVLLQTKNCYFATIIKILINMLSSEHCIVSKNFENPVVLFCSEKVKNLHFLYTYLQVGHSMSTQPKKGDFESHVFRFRSIFFTISTHPVSKKAAISLVPAPSGGGWGASIIFTLSRGTQLQQPIPPKLWYFDQNWFHSSKGHWILNFLSILKFSKVESWTFKLKVQISKWRCKWELPFKILKKFP